MTQTARPRRPVPLVPVALAALIPVGLWIHRLAYQTMGEVPSGIFALGLMLAAVPVVLLVVFGRSHRALVIGWICWTLIGSLPLVLSHRLHALYGEADTIVSFLAVEIRTVHDLSLVGSAPIDPTLAPYLRLSIRGHRVGLMLDPLGSFTGGYRCSFDLPLRNGRSIPRSSELPCRDPSDWFFEAD